MRQADRTGGLLVFLSLLVLGALLVGVVMQSLPDAAVRHMLFAVGILPLILAAMLYFVPVLTRSAPAHGAMLLLPPLAFVLGIGVVIAMPGHAEWLSVLAGCVLVLVCIEIGWTLRRRSRVLGKPHAGLDWYLYALALLILALIMIVSRAFWPEYWTAARNVHLHLNIFGFLGLTAIGTLRVLLPTALAEADPDSTQFLRRQLPWAVCGALAIAFGAALWKPMAILGALAWSWTAAQMLRVLLRRGHWLNAHAASISLGAAAIGWLLLLAAGIAHALGDVTRDAMFALLVFVFLLPLVTGATSHLLPVWRWPGRLTAAHARMRLRLTKYSGLRVGAFWGSGLAALWGYEYAFIPGALALAGYLFQVVSAFLSVRNTS